MLTWLVSTFTPDRSRTRFRSAPSASRRAPLAMYSGQVARSAWLNTAYEVVTPQPPAG
jgi:hypothetical protein